MTKEQRSTLLITQFGFNQGTADAYIESMGKCMYCDDDVFQFRQGYSSAQIDHILPVKKYPELRWNIKNWIFSCSSCNGMKGDFDVLVENEDPIAEIENNRNELIKRIRSRLKEQISARNKDYLAIRKIVQMT